MLHIIKTIEKLNLALAYRQPSEHLLLTEDAVYAALPSHELAQQLMNIEEVSVLEPDLNSRGLQNLVSKSLTKVDYLGFVTLTEQHQQSITW
jgi:tRNA 2-thiouridine synthesizing protein B